MRNSKRVALKKKGWKIGGAEEFLELTSEEAAYVDMKLRLSESLRARRRQRKLTQSQVASLIKSSQSRVAKMETGDPTVSLDLLIRSLLALGASEKDLAKTIAS